MIIPEITIPIIDDNMIIRSAFVGLNLKPTKPRNRKSPRAIVSFFNLMRRMKPIKNVMKTIPRLANKAVCQSVCFRKNPKGRRASRTTR